MRRLIFLALAAGLFCFQCSPLNSGTRASTPAIARAAENAGPQPPKLTFPLEKKSVRFAVIGDNGTGQPDEYQVGREMAQYHQIFPFDFVIMLGDNIYGGHNPEDFVRKFEAPYKPLLDDGVKFYASLGNHDKPLERFYKLYNMNGQNYYSFKKGGVRFFALDSNYMNPRQLDWLQQQLRSATEKWKICYFHHPLYSDARYHGSDLDLRAQLAPLFKKYGVNVVFSGHDHVYERIKPQNGIYYFVEGNSGQLRYHNLRPSPADMAAGFDTDQAFMIVEIAGDDMYFQTIARTGNVVDHALLKRQANPQRAASLKPQPPHAAAGSP